ncbi:MAG: aminoacyl-tRNA hydrolase [Candidatus Magasanikbacteria bacterium]|jgi:peptidyl-tRNA hydrolase, PTH1 family|nr:aminoacyl-tRNA hydrolase [Candidatus Magasanikbacteria bacterium]
MKLIVGLGNPGSRYTKTRHNVGFMIIDALFEKLAHEGLSSPELSKKFNAVIAGGMVQGEKVFLVKPMTYMNNSGQSVGLIAHFYKIPAEDIIVIHDDKDIALGEIKMQKDRGHGGHNGIRSITEHLKTKDFHRVRVGIKSKNEKRMEDTSRFVLGKFSLFEKPLLGEVIKQSVKNLQEMLNCSHSK